MDRTSTIRQRLAALELELAERALYGEDTFNNNDIITFTGNFGGPTNYWYAAIKAGGVWHLTGRESSRFTWDGLVDFFKRANVAATDIRVVTKTKRLFKV